MSTKRDGEDVYRFPEGIQADFVRRNAKPPKRLTDFRPANHAILVRDLDREFDEPRGFLDLFHRKYPRAWGYVWASRPGYSKDGNLALICFEGGPNGEHGMD